jgi:TonB family protein
VTLSAPTRHQTLDLAFRTDWQSPGHLRFEILGGPKAMLLLCEGGDGYTLSPSLPARQTPAGDLCPASPTRWETLTDGLISAVFDGPGTALVEGRSQPCEHISAEYSAVRGLLPGTPNEILRGSMHRDLCVDRARLLVLADDVEGRLNDLRRGPLRIHTSTTFDILQPDAALGPNAFRPAPSQPFLPEPRITRPLPPAGSTQPEVLYRREPEYTDEARTVRFQGTARLQILIGADGVPREPRLLSPFGYGLDLKAIEAICDWRFRPATDNGRGVSRTAIVEMAFRLAPE